MNFLKDNFEIIVILLFAASLAMLSIIFSMNKYFIKYFSNKKFRIITSYEVDAKDANRYFTITIYNNNINEVRLSGFGYVYQNQNIDFYKNYLIEQGFPNDHKIVIHSRDYLITKIDINQLKTIISDINKGEFKVTKMKAFVTDSLGISNSTNAKQVKKQIDLMIKKDQLEVETKHKEQKKKLRKEQAELKKNKRKLKNQAFKEKWHRLVLKIKGLLKIKK
jgi:hypothetical protein